MKGVRIDKYLWSIRMYKTRSLATDACKRGRVVINNVDAKPSKEVEVDDIISFRVENMMKTLRVIGLIEKRVSFSLATQYYEDITPQEEYDKLKKIRETNIEYRPKGLGRPTKKERRRIDWLKGTKS